MNRRDYLAGVALRALLERHGSWLGFEDRKPDWERVDVLAVDCYRVADAMERVSGTGESAFSPRPEAEQYQYPPASMKAVDTILSTVALDTAPPAIEEPQSKKAKKRNGEEPAKVPT